MPLKRIAGGLTFVALLILAAQFRSTTGKGQPQAQPSSDSSQDVAAELEHASLQNDLETPARKVPLREVQALPGDREDPSDPLDDLSRRLHVDRISRASHPEEYAQVISALARRGFRDNLQQEGRLEATASKFAGFESVEALQSAIKEWETTDPFRASEYSKLYTQATTAAVKVNNYASSACDDPQQFEVYMRDRPELREQWMNARGSVEHGLHRFTTATSIGDRCFCLHFDSAYYPDLEFDLQELKSMRKDLDSRYSNSH